MKTFLAFIGLMIVSIATYATSDTLTIAQVYNFDIGDTFDYQFRIKQNSILVNEFSFERLVVKQKTYNAGNDTLRYYLAPPGGNISDSLIITDLDSIADFKLTSLQNCLTPAYVFNDSTTYPGYISNVFSKNCSGYIDSIIFTEGLGETYYWYYFFGGGGDGLNISSRKLIYYHKINGAAGGIPYYIANGSTIPYVPLPESCASWTRTLTHNDSLAIVEEVRTGNTIIKNNIHYVELICRIENYISNRFTPDSSIGYFYNDSLAKTAYFVTDTASASPVVLCAFNNLYGQQCSSIGYYTIDSVLIGNNYRTRWTCGPLALGDPNNSMIAGIGYLTGLIPINTYYDGIYVEDGQLTCFSVCGQILYPTGSAGDCAMLTSIHAIDADAFTLSLYPTLASTNIYVSTSISKKLVCNIYDINGQLITEAYINPGENTGIDVSKLAGGLYMAQFKNNDYTLSRRFVVAH